MHQFYLNDCLGSAKYDLSDLADGLVTVICAFTELANIPKLHINKGWVIEKAHADMAVGGVKLQDIVANMCNRESRRLFYVYCTKYPIHQHFKCSNEEAILLADYKFDNADATNLAITAQNEGILLTLPVSDFLQKNVLQIASDIEGFEAIEIPSLHGASVENKDFIQRLLLDRNYYVNVDLEKLDSLALNVYFSDKFKNRFKELTNTDKKSIFDRIDEARNGQLLFPSLTCNGTVISHVEKHVEELRIVNPVDIRVYFHEEGGRFFFAKIAFKNEYKGQNDQNEDIQESELIIVEMMNCVGLITMGFN